MPLPIFRDDGALPNPFAAPPPTNTPYRPTRPSPLSSSPTRPSNSPPLSPRDANIRRDIQSSPIAAPPPRYQLQQQQQQQQQQQSKFATRPARPNPLTQKREVAQESRRKLFLKNVRQRAEDQRWERRGGEQELEKLEWVSFNKDLRAWQAKAAAVDGAVNLDSDIEDAARLREEAMRSRPSRKLSAIPEVDMEMGVDDMLVDMFEQEQQAELEAMAEAMSSGDTPPLPPDTPHWSDEDEYDALFMDYLAREQQEGPVHSQDVGCSGDMDLS
ncbi:unnamed protein product [Discula destructiva]